MAGKLMLGQQPDTLFEIHHTLAIYLVLEKNGCN